jgi:archaellum component FlaC
VGNRNFANKKVPTRVLVVQEEYESGGEDEESDGEVVGVAAIAKTTSTISPITTPSLFNSPNENATNNSHKCLMAKATSVTPSSKPTPPPSTKVDNAMSLKIKCEVVSLDAFLTNIDGDTKVHFEALLTQLGEANERLEEQEETIEALQAIEREAANEIASLSQTLEEEQELRATLEDSVSSLEETFNIDLAKLTKDRDHALAMNKVLNNEKVEFDLGHARLVEDLEKLEKAHKALKSEFSILSKSFEQRQIQSTNDIILLKNDELSMPTNICCEHAFLMEENARLKSQVKEGLANHSKKKNKKKNKKKKVTSSSPLKAIAYEKEGEKSSNIVGIASKGHTDKSSFAGTTNPSYMLSCTKDGHVFARYVGSSYNDYYWSIWVPKTLVANMRGPIQKWVPKTKK